MNRLMRQNHSVFTEINFYNLVPFTVPGETESLESVTYQHSVKNYNLWKTSKNVNPERVSDESQQEQKISFVKARSSYL